MKPIPLVAKMEHKEVFGGKLPKAHQITPLRKIYTKITYFPLQ